MSKRQACAFITCCDCVRCARSRVCPLTGLCPGAGFLRSHFTNPFKKCKTQLRQIMFDACPSRCVLLAVYCEGILYGKLVVVVGVPLSRYSFAGDHLTPLGLATAGYEVNMIWWVAGTWQYEGRKVEPTNTLYEERRRGKTIRRNNVGSNNNTNNTRRANTTKDTKWGLILYKGTKIEPPYMMAQRKNLYYEEKMWSQHYIMKKQRQPEPHKQRSSNGKTCWSISRMRRKSIVIGRRIVL